ncbi:MAG: helix-turn-helix domain-containing protein [Ancalomicrobiaceae bacterium]|nr:helix-turn-helix domain-containing protein [Ancalomicrobiaceae bacterium]
MGTSGSLPILVDEKIAAAKLGLSPRTLQAWRVSGGGPIYRKIGRRVVYAECDLLAFVDAGTRAHTSEGAR